MSMLDKILQETRAADDITNRIKRSIMAESAATLLLAMMGKEEYSKLEAIYGGGALLPALFLLLQWLHSWNMVRAYRAPDHGDRGSGIGDRGSGIGDRGSGIEDRGSGHVTISIADNDGPDYYLYLRFENGGAKGSARSSPTVHHRRPAILWWRPTSCQDAPSRACGACRPAPWFPFRSR